MLFVALVVFYEGIQAVTEDIRERLFLRNRHRLVEHDALAKPRTADGELLEVHVLCERFYDRERRGKNIRAPRRKPLDFLLFVEVEHLNRVVNALEILDGEHIVVHRIQGILAHELADFENIAEGAAHADHLRVGIDFLEPLNSRELFGEEFLHLFRLRLRGKAVVLEQIGQRDRAEGKGDEVEHVAAVVIHNLCAAAPNLQNDALGDIHGVDYAAVDERRLLLFAQNAHLDAAGRLNLVQKAALVLRAAHRRRSHRDDAVYPARIRKLFEHFQRAYGLRNPLRL